ncbi:hypothetical protein [Mycobacterium colombiense]|uniref:hypothetical protein n=1 Tax=Mycobacterium colombiense TaxID=339268 RepID=UPI0011155C85|nr:hypothetical protein [Mycobacterium colombiense]
MSASSRPVRNSYPSKAATRSDAVIESKDANSRSSAASNLSSHELQRLTAIIERMFEYYDSLPTKSAAVKTPGPKWRK